MAARITITSITLILFVVEGTLASAPRAIASTLAPDLMPIETAIFTNPGSIKAIVPLSDNRVLVSGQFTTIAGQSTPHSVAIVRANGSIEPSFRLDPDLKVIRITDAEVQNDGKILLAGLFKLSSNNYTVSIIRLNVDGSIDQPFTTATISILTVHTILVDNNNILIGGTFQEPSPYLARLDLDGTPDPSFTVDSGPNGTVYDIARQSNGQYLIVGDFSTYDGTSQTGLARLQPNGRLDSSFAASGFRPSQRVAVLNDGTVLVGGKDICGSGQSFAWYTASGVMKPLPSWAAPNQLHEITAFLPLPDGGFLVGGWFAPICINQNATEHRGEVRRYAANGDFRILVSFGNQSDVLAMALRSDGNVVIGGIAEPQRADAIGLFNGLTLLSIANDGLERSDSFNLLVGDEATIYSLSAYPDGRLLVGGSFSHVNGQPRFGLARLLANGQLDTTFAPLSDQPRSWVITALALPDGRAVFGSNTGLYIVAQNQQLTNISALINYDWPQILFRQPDGRVLVGCTGDIYRLSVNLNTLDFQSSVSGAVYDLVLDPVSGKIVAAGDFGVIRLNSDGTLDPQFSAPTFSQDTFPAQVYSIAFTHDGKLLVGGNFDHVNNREHAALARLTDTGALDNTFAPVTGFRNVKSICVQAADGAIWISGATLAKLSADGRHQMTFNYQYYHNSGEINQLICTGDQLRWVGGQFGLIDQRPFYGVARYAQVQSRAWLPLLTR
ncbi:MAG: hypothetical protein K6356_08740 [Chloroflexus sp.]